MPAQASENVVPKPGGHDNDFGGTSTSKGIAASHAEPLSATTNQFSILSAGTPSTAGYTREITVVSKTRVRVRLLGPPCIIIGTCTLWMKSGRVSVCGAMIDNIMKAHHLYSPTSHAVPVIKAVDGVAEFELESSDSDVACRGLQSLEEAGFPKVWQVEPSSKPSSMTFSVMGYHYTPDPTIPTPYRVLDTNEWQQKINSLSCMYSTSTGPPRFLIHGAPNCGTSTFAQNFLNCLSSRYPPQIGVAFVDLEAVRPAFTPPGTVCLQQVKTAVFGPPFTRPAANSGPVVKCHYVGSKGELTAWYLQCALDLLAYEATNRDTESKKPVIIHAPKWLTALSTDSSANATTMKQQIWAALRPTNVIYLSNSDDGFLASVPKSTTIIAQPIYSKPFPQYDLAMQSHMTMQAYFHMVFDEKNGDRYFNNLPILRDQSKTFQLSFDNGGPLKGIIVNTSTVASANINHAVIGNLAAVLSVSVEALNALGYWNMTVGQTLTKLPGDLDTTLFPAREVKFLGFGYVLSVNTNRRELSLITPIKAAVLEKGYRKEEGAQLVLVVPAGDTAWLQKEATKV